MSTVQSFICKNSITKYIHLIMATLIPLAVVALAGPAIIALVFYRK